MSVSREQIQNSLDQLKREDRQQAYTAQVKFMVWALCAFRNYPQIEMDFMTQTDPPPDLERFKHVNPYVGQPAIILGSGPSLDTSIEYLKDWKGPIFCGPTHSQILMAHGITPTFIGIYDSANTPENMGLPLLRYPDTYLLSTPMVNPDINMMWKWKKLYHLLVSGDDDMWGNMALSFKDFVQLKKPKPNTLMMDILPDPVDHLDELLKIIYHKNPILKGGMGHLIKRAGCVTNELAIIASQCLRCDPLFFVGCDNAFVSRRFRATSYVYDGSRFRRRVAPLIDDLPPGHLLGYMERDGFPTLSQYWIYLRGLITVSTIASPDENGRGIVMNPFIAGKEFGLTGPFPTVDIELVVKRQGRGFPSITIQEARARADDWFQRNPYEGGGK